MAALHALLLLAVAACEVNARQYFRAGGQRPLTEPQADLKQLPQLARDGFEGEAAVDLGKVQKFSQILAADPAVMAQLDEEASLLARENKKENGGIVIVTTSNARYVNLTLNLFESMKQVGRRQLLVFCDDPVCYAELKPKAPYGMRVLHLLGRNNSGEARFNSPVFNKITSGKLAYISWFLNRNFTVLFTDSDIAWLKDPVPDVMSQLGPSLVIQDDTPELWAHLNAPVKKRHFQCTGFFLLRPTALGKMIIDMWESMLAQGSRRDFTAQDQLVSRRVFNSTCQSWCADELDDCTESSDCRLLARRRFPNGKTIRDWGKPVGDFNPWAEMIIAHANWHEGTKEKMAMLVNNSFWYLPG